jgi:hypothetical protein
MMMAYDAGQTPPGRLDNGTTDAVRTALQDYLAASPSAEPRLQQALLAMAAEAREKAILPEHVLVALKDLWNCLPEVRSMTNSAEQVRLLQRVVTMCIKEYYTD